MDNFWKIFIFPLTESGKAWYESQMGYRTKWPCWIRSKVHPGLFPTPPLLLQQLLTAAELKNIRRVASIPPACFPPSNSSVLQGLLAGISAAGFPSVDSLSRNLPSCSSDTLQTICIENIAGMSSSTSTALWVKYQHFLIIFGLETSIWYLVAVLGKGFPVHLQSSVEGSVAVSFFSLSTFSPDHLFTGWKYL